MKREKEKVTVFKESVLKILYEYQKGISKRPIKGGTTLCAIRRKV